METKKVLCAMSLDELEKFSLELGASKFRAKQIHNWIFLKSVDDIEKMSNLGKDFRQKLAEVAQITTTKIKRRQISQDGTIKYLLEFEDGNCAETVLMRFDNRANLTACVSSQVGCAMGCKFCATAKQGFIRNLSVFEIIDQILTIQRDTGLKITNVVFMGQGEPLLNLDNVLKAIETLNSELNISKRRITVSTCGLIPQIKKLASIDFQPTLAVSLHAVTSQKRLELMPVEQKHNIKELISTLKDYTDETSRRVTIEYTLIKGINDSIEDAKSLAILLKNLKANINLIIYNPCDNEDIYQKPDRAQVMRFKCILENANKKVTIRLERGADIDAACGQLTGKTLP